MNIMAEEIAMAEVMKLLESEPAPALPAANSPELREQLAMMGHLNSFSASGGGEFEQKFCKNSNARGLPRGGGMLKLRFDWYISCACKHVYIIIYINRS